RRRLEGAVEVGERPALLLRARQQAGEDEQQAGEAVQLPGDERLRVGELEYPQRLLDAGTAQLVGREVGLLDRFGQLPAAAPTRCRDRPPLRLEAGAAVLPVGAHPTTRDPASQLVSSSAPLAAARAHLFQPPDSKHAMLYSNRRRASARLSGNAPCSAQRQS